MDYFIYVVVIVAIVLLKLGVIIGLYACRVRRLRALCEQRTIVAQPYPVAGAAGSGAYPAAPYNQRSAMVNFEELPQPSSLHQPGSEVTEPPKYEDVTSSNDRPPAYTEAVQMEKV